MKPFIIFKLTSGHSFELSTRVIAENRAAHYHKSHPEEFPTLQSSLDDTIGLFEDGYEISDWLFGNMEIDDVINEHGRLIAFTPPPLDFGDADVSYGDAASAAQQLDGETILGTPVELVMNSMAQDDAFCNVQMLMDPTTGAPNMAIAFIRGGPNVVGAFVQGLQEVTNFVAAKQQEEAAAAAASGLTH